MTEFLPQISSILDQHILNGANNTTIEQAAFNNVGRDQVNHYYSHVSPLWKAIADIEASHDSEPQFNDQEHSLLGAREEAVLRRIREWRDSGDRDVPVCWYSDLAGVGNSVIALTIAKEWEEEGELVASFFFSRTDPRRNNPSSLFLSIAYGLGVARPHLKSFINQKIATDRRILKARIENQYKELILKNLNHPPPLPTAQKAPDLVIISGLDECDNADVQRRVISIIFSTYQRQFHYPLRYLICSRPEPHIQESFESSRFRALTKHLKLDDSIPAQYNIRGPDHVPQSFNTGYPSDNSINHQPQHQSNVSHYYSAVKIALPAHSSISPGNTKELTREMLIDVLEYLSSLMEVEFKGIAIRLVAHGGACMLLHPGLHELAKKKSLYHSSRGESVPMRRTTRDVNYIRRGFVAEYVGEHKIADADYKLQMCIRATAVKFGLGVGWMNADADVALPMSATSTGIPYDPIYHASLQPFNVRLYTVFTSKNQKLTIVNVTPAWAVALKLVRYARWDPTDILLLLMNGTNLSKVHWTVQVIKEWLTDECSAMNYHNWDAPRLKSMSQKIEHAAQMVISISTNLAPAQVSTYSVAALQLLSSSSHSNGLQPVGPNVCLDPGSNSWHPSITNNAPASSLESLGLRALGQALPAPANQSDLPPFIPNFPADPSSSLSWKQNTKEKRPSSDKAAKRRKEKQRRDRETDFSRRFRWEGRGSLLDDPRDFVHREKDDSESDSEEKTDSSEEEESKNGSLEYVPMPVPPTEVYTREWQEQRHREEKEWNT